MQLFAQLLMDQREALIAKWEAAVLADPEVPRAAHIPERALRDHVPVLIDSLTSVLKTHGEHCDDLNLGREFAKKFSVEHAADRAALGYTLTAALRELSHLRSVLVNFWWEHEGLDSRGVRMIHAAIDECMAAAAAHMERVASAALRQEMSLLENVLRLLPVGVFISDAKGGQIASNAAFRAVWGDTPEATSSWQEYERFVGFDSQTGKRLGAEDWGLAVALRTGQTVKQQLDIVSFEGERKMILNQAGPLFDPATGDISGGVAVVVDETEMLTAFRKLKEETELRDIFIGVLGHDLRTPLASIMLRAATLLRSELDEGSIGFIRRILRSAELMERMISDILDFTRARASKIPITVTAGDLWEICEEVVDECRQAHPRRKVLFVAQGNGLGAWDRDRLTQVFGNLVGNAITYSPPETDVRVHADNNAASGLRIEVHNTGNPIPRDQLSQIFEPFTRAAPHTANRSGLGLGLYIAKQIVESHGGKITVTSTAEEGTSFVVELPRQPQERAVKDHADGEC